MIVKEIVNDFVFHYSDLNMKIKQVETGLIYDNAMDKIPCRFTYEETDIPIPVMPEENNMAEGGEQWI